MLSHEGFWYEISIKEELNEFDAALMSLRRQFRKLLKVAKIHNKCKQSTNTSEEDLNGISKTSNDTSERIKDAADSSSEHKIDVIDIVDDVLMTECDNVTKKLSSNVLSTPKIIEDNLLQDEIPEILSVEFDTKSEQSLFDQLEQSKLNSNHNKSELQKSPVFYKSRFRSKKTLSSKLNPISSKDSPNSEEEKSKIIRKREEKEEEEEVTANRIFTPKSANASSSVVKSLFSSIKEKEHQILTPPKPKLSQKLGISNLYNVNTSPKPKASQKVGISNLYNLNTNSLGKGNKLKQTKLVLVPDKETTDISKLLHFNNEAENSAVDSIFDSTIFNCNSSFENMDIEIENSPTIAKRSVDIKSSVSSTPKKIQTLIKDDFEKISPTKENKKLDSKNYVPSKKQKTDDLQTSRFDLNVFKPQACSTQICSQKEESMIGMNTKHSEFDTDFTFHVEHAVNKQLSPNTKKASPFRKKTSPSTKKSSVDTTKKGFPFKLQSDKGCIQSNESKITENVLDDETFFSPGEYQNDSHIIEHVKPSTSRETVTAPRAKRVLTSKFDEIPGKKNCSPDYPYVQSVRNKCERAKLNGWACWDCKKYYQNLDLPEKELKECLKKCSRHKAKYDPNYHTPPDFWNPAFTDTFAPTLFVLNEKK